ncbi:MAG: acyl carrier protein [Rhizobiaceae bacterium]
MDNLEETIQILARALFIPSESIKAEDKLLELKGMDSLAFETIIVELEDATGRDIDVAQAVGTETVADLAELLQKLRSA